MNEYTSISKRVALITYRLLMGKKLRVIPLADELGVDRRTIYRDFNAISLVVPIYNEKGLWQLCDGADQLPCTIPPPR